jgi:hypothetical protein
LELLDVFTVELVGVALDLCIEWYKAKAPPPSTNKTITINAMTTGFLCGFFDRSAALPPMVGVLLGCDCASLEIQLFYFHRVAYYPFCLLLAILGGLHNNYNKSIE